MAPGIDEKNMVFAPKNVCFPPYFPASMVFGGKWKNPNKGGVRLELGGVRVVVALYYEQ